MTNVHLPYSAPDEVQVKHLHPQACDSKPDDLDQSTAMADQQGRPAAHDRLNMRGTLIFYQVHLHYEVDSNQNS